MDRNHNDEYIPELLVVIQPNIGLDGSTRQSTVDLLNHFLADEAVLNAKTCSAQWNVKGLAFFTLHAIFDAQSAQLIEISDEIAERVRMLGGYVLGSLQDFLGHTRLMENPGQVPDTLHLLADHEALIRLLREDGKKCIEEYEDEGTYDLLVSIIRRHEKIAWMLRSYVETESTGA